MKKPDHTDVMEETIELIHEEMDDGWRHGVNVTEVYKREEDNTFWQFEYRRSGDGEWNGLREDEYEVEQVWPVEVTVTQYVTKKPA
jgi:hypothetical protein